MNRRGRERFRALVRRMGGRVGRWKKNKEKREREGEVNRGGRGGRERIE